MNAQPLLIASAPNGAYKTRDDHVELPITAAQLADTSARVMQVGAAMLHLHVRDQHGKHTLAANAYRDVIEAIRARVGSDLFIQATSEAAGIYTSAQQRQAIAALGDVADGISVSVRELFRDDADTIPTKELFHDLAQQHVLLQHILYSTDDINKYASLREQGIIPPDQHSVLLVIGRHDEQPSTPDTLHDMLATLQSSLDARVNWMICAFGEHEFECLSEATELGGHVRIGFENSLNLNSGEPAKDNAELITQLLESGNPHNRSPANIQQARRILGA